MRLLSNKEIRMLLIILTALSVAGVLLAYFFAPVAALIVGGLAVLLCVAFSVFTKWRYRQIASLSDYIKKLNQGDYSLDLRDNDEGELSLLKNELYKVTVTLRQQNETLIKEKEQLADALSDISHQIKTPLTSMFVMTDLLGDEALPEEKRREFTDRIRAQLDRLHFLVSALLKLSRLDAKTVQFKRQSVSPDALLAGATEPLLIPMELKNQRLRVSTDGKAFLCDAQWTKEALLNIVKNCVEHTREGGVIEIACETTPLFTRIVIGDSGDGIDPADLPHLFERFYKGKNAGDDSVGIGLAMAAAIIAGQGGHIEAQNKPDGGAAFIVTLQ